MVHFYIRKKSNFCPISTKTEIVDPLFATFSVFILIFFMRVQKYKSYETHILDRASAIFAFSKVYDIPLLSILFRAILF